MSSSVVADPDSAAALIRLQRRGPSPGCLYRVCFVLTELKQDGHESGGLEESRRVRGVVGNAIE